MVNHNVLEFRSASVVLLSGRFPAVPDALQQPTLTLGVLLGGVARVDLSGLPIHHLVCPVCLSDAVRHTPLASGRQVASQTDWERG